MAGYSLSPRTFQDLQSVISSTSIGPQQRAAIDNPRIAKIRSLLIDTFTSGGQKSMSQADRDLLDMVITFVVAQDLIPGVHDTGQQYAELLSAMQLSDFNSKALSNPDYYTTGALNAQGVLNDLMYNNDGSYNTTVTQGMGAELSSTVGARIFEDVLLQSQLSNKPAMQEVDFGSNAQQMQEAISGLVKNGNFRVGGSIHNRLQKQQKQIKALEYAAAADFLFSQSADGKVGGVSRAQFDNMSVTEKQQFINLNTSRDLEGNFKFVDKQGNAVSHQEVMHTFLEDTNTVNNVKYGNAIMGERIDYDAYNRAKQQTLGESKETMLTADARRSMETRMSRASESIQFLSKTFGTDQFDALQQIANDLNLGSLTGESNINNVKQQLRQAIQIALSTNRDIKDVLQERADLIKALAPDHGGQQYVNSKFVSQVQLMRASIQYQQDEAGVALRSDEEAIAASQRSYNNTVNQFGGVALAEYAAENLEYLPEEEKARYRSMAEEAKKRLQAGDRAGARAISDQLNRELSFLSPAVKRQAYSEYATDLNELSVNEGLAEQVQYAFDVALKNNKLDLFEEGATDEQKAAGVDIARKSLKDALYITGSDAKTVDTYIKDLKRYEGIETAEEKAKFEEDLRRRLIEEGFEEEDVEQYVSSIKNISEAGINVDKFSSFLNHSKNNTDTYAFGKSAKRAEWSSFYDSISAKKNKSYGMEDIGQLIVAGIFGDGAQNIDAEEALDLEYYRYLKDQGVDENGNLKGNVKGFLSNTEDDITAAYLGNIDQKGTFVDEEGNSINEKVAEDLWNNEDFKKLLKLNNIEVDEKQFKAGVSKRGMRYLKEFADENNLQIGDIQGELFLTDTTEYNNRSLTTNKQLETLRNIDLAPYIKEGTDDEGNADPKGNITKKESIDIFKALYGEDFQTSHMVDGKFAKGTLFEGKTLEEARTYLNDKKEGTDLTNAESLHDYKLRSTEITENTIQKQTEGIVTALGGIGKVVEQLFNFLKGKPDAPATTN